MNLKTILNPQKRIHLLFMVFLFLTLPTLKSYATYSLTVITHDNANTSIGEGVIQVTADGHSGPYTVYWSDNTTSIITPLSGIFTTTKGGLTQGHEIVTIENAHGCKVDLQVIINGYNGPYISISAFLEGPFNVGVDLMENKLSTLGYIPLVEPYSSLGYSFPINSGGGETTTDSIISDFGVVDWIVVELHDNTGLTWARSGLLLNTGKIVDTDGVSDLVLPTAITNEDQFYIKLHHRNHLDVKMIDPIQLDSDRITVDFSDPKLNTTDQKSLTQNRVGLQAGDANYDNCVDAEDRSITWNDRNLVGYLSSDLNLDGVVDAQDRTIAYNNRNTCYISAPDPKPECDDSQNIWIGPADGEAWGASDSNWSKGRIPTECDDVLIPSGNKVFIPSSYSATCSTIHVELGAELDMALGAMIHVEYYE